jgi:alpha-tubulin suppressor-like RCC1 family protein
MYMYMYKLKCAPIRLVQALAHMHVTRITCGGQYSLARVTEATYLYVWGSNSERQLGYAVSRDIEVRLRARATGEKTV